ncbi:MAG TPA: hypothetical protein V6C72_07365, partial [Chroococcales cyanobacterium]
MPGSISCREGDYPSHHSWIADLRSSAIGAFIGLTASSAVALIHALTWAFSVRERFHQFSIWTTMESPAEHLQNWALTHSNMPIDAARPLFIRGWPLLFQLDLLQYGLPIT